MAMGNLGGNYNFVTSYEIQVIETYVKNLSKLMPLSSALSRLRLFSPEEVESPTSPGGFYNASTHAEEVYEHYKKQNPPFFIKQKLDDYEDLKHAAISYCERHELL